MADDIVIGAKQFKNPENAYPSYDTERPVASKIPGGGNFSIENYHRDEKPKKDISNPVSTDIEPKEKHPLIEHFNRKPTARRHFGAGIVTEN